MIPRIFNLLQKGEFDEATRLYWQTNPARRAAATTNAYMAQTSFLHRMMWKYQGWLNGYNGGPMRRPTMRLNDATMRRCATGSCSRVSSRRNRTTASSSSAAIRPNSIDWAMGRGGAGGPLSNDLKNRH